MRFWDLFGECGALANLTRLGPAWKVEFSGRSWDTACNGFSAHPNAGGSAPITIYWMGCHSQVLVLIVVMVIKDSNKYGLMRMQN